MCLRNQIRWFWIDKSTPSIGECAQPLWGRSYFVRTRENERMSARSYTHAHTRSFSCISILFIHYPCFHLIQKQNLTLNNLCPEERQRNTQRTKMRRVRDEKKRNEFPLTVYFSLHKIRRILSVFPLLLLSFFFNITLKSRVVHVHWHVSKSFLGLWFRFYSYIVSVMQFRM